MFQTDFKDSDFQVKITKKNNKTYVRAYSKDGKIEEAEELISKINESLSQGQNMDKIKELTKGKAKSLFSTADNEKLVMHFSDDTSAFDGKKKEALSRKFIQIM